MQIPEVLPEWVGANLALQGIANLTMLPPSTRIFFPGDAVLVVDAEYMPCIGPWRDDPAVLPRCAEVDAVFPEGCHA
jgi:hypothetical protein